MILCDGYGTQLGELAIGQNLKVAFHALERIQL